jgi:hypothetical protein
MPRVGFGVDAMYQLRGRLGPVKYAGLFPIVGRQYVLFGFNFCANASR